MSDPIPLSPDEIRAALDATYEVVADARMVVGHHIPSAVRVWAEERNLELRETEFAPPNRLFIIGAVVVPDIFIP
jgi:hypothetical protein